MENPEGEDEGYGVVGGIKSPGGSKNPIVERPPQGTKTCRVPPNGDEMPGGDRRRQGGDKNYQATQGDAAENGGAKEGSNTPK